MTFATVGDDCRASSGIVEATALAFAKAGIDIAGSRSRKIKRLWAAAQQTGVKVKAYHLDLADWTSSRSLFWTQDFGAIDILVNNAGMGYTNSLSETPLSDWLQVMNLNLISIPVHSGNFTDDARTLAIINVASVVDNTPFWEPTPSAKLV